MTILFDAKHLTISTPTNSEKGILEASGVSINRLTGKELQEHADVARAMLVMRPPYEAVRALVDFVDQYKSIFGVPAHIGGSGVEYIPTDCLTNGWRAWIEVRTSSYQYRAGNAFGGGTRVGSTSHISGSFWLEEATAKQWAKEVFAHPTYLRLRPDDTGRVIGIVQLQPGEEPGFWQDAYIKERYCTTSDEAEAEVEETFVVDFGRLQVMATRPMPTLATLGTIHRDAFWIGGNILTNCSLMPTSKVPVTIAGPNHHGRYFVATSPATIVADVLHFDDGRDLAVPEMSIESGTLVKVVFSGDGKEVVAIIPR